MTYSPFIIIKTPSNNASSDPNFVYCSVTGVPMPRLDDRLETIHLKPTSGSNDYDSWVILLELSLPPTVLAFYVHIRAVEGLKSPTWEAKKNVAADF